MKKYKALALAAACLCGSAAAQTGVTLYGKVDLGVGKVIGKDVTEVKESQAGNSRFGLRGVEDLGGGLSAFFGLEHRFRADSGEQVSTIYWHGFATVGLSSRSLGSITLGRQYIPSFWLVQNQVDPFNGLTVANLRDGSMLLNNTAKVRVSDSVRYDYSAAGFNFAASIADTTQPGASAGPERPRSIAANYASGPLFIGIGYEDPAQAEDHIWSAGARYKISSLTLSAGLSKGRTPAGVDAKGWMVAATHPLGNGLLKGGYARGELGSATTMSKIGVGYDYNLSKRTKLYTNLARDGKVAAHRWGFDVGVEHNF